MVLKSMLKYGGLPLYKPATNNAQPISPFGFHIHEYGVCEIIDPTDPYTSAGGDIGIQQTNPPMGIMQEIFQLYFQTMVMLE